MFDNFIFAESQLKSREDERIANSRHLEEAALCKRSPALVKPPANQEQPAPVLLTRRRNRLKFLTRPLAFLAAQRGNR
jgi:hypothetical protein